MYGEVIAYFSILRRWRSDPHAPRRAYSFMCGWQDSRPENDLPLSDQEVTRIKAWMRRHAPTVYLSIFPEERQSGASAGAAPESLVGRRWFADGAEQPVYEGADGRQYVVGDDGQLVYGVWIIPQDAAADLPVIVEPDRAKG
jgi:hypothetical protein